MTMEVGATHLKAGQVRAAGESVRNGTAEGHRTLPILVAGDYIDLGCLLGKELEDQLWLASTQQPEPSWPEPTAL